jgi:hypothetical protein
MKLCNLSVFAVLILALSNSGFAEGIDAPYPEGYRSWFHVKTMLIEPGHQLENPFQGIHHVYANSKAVKGLHTGTYSDGSVLVFDLLNYSEKDLTIQEGDRKLVGIMHKDSNKYSSTGGWGFEGFAGDSRTQRLVSDDGSSCYGCHTAVESSAFVFTKYRP